MNLVNRIVGITIVVFGTLVLLGAVAFEQFSPAVYVCGVTVVIAGVVMLRSPG